MTKSRKVEPIKPGLYHRAAISPLDLPRVLSGQAAPVQSAQNATIKDEPKVG